MDDDVIDNTVKSFTALIVGVILFCAVGIPIVSKMIGYLTATNAEGGFVYGSDVPMYETLITVAMIMVLVGLVIGIIRRFTIRNR